MELSALSAAAPVQPLADNMVQMSHLDEKSVLVRPRFTSYPSHPDFHAEAGWRATGLGSTRSSLGGSHAESGWRAIGVGSTRSSLGCTSPPPFATM